MISCLAVVMIIQHCHVWVLYYLAKNGHCLGYVLHDNMFTCRWRILKYEGFNWWTEVKLCVENLFNEKLKVEKNKS